MGGILGMRRKMGGLGRPFLLALVLGLLSSCGGGGSGGGGNGKPAPAWTVLVYMDGDNNLAQAAQDDLTEMEAVGSSDQVNVIVQVSLPNADTMRYRVAQGSLQPLADLGAVPMAAPAPITDFLTWAKAAYPSQRRLLVLWDHGNGWDQGDGPSSAPAARHASSILEDDASGNRFVPNYQVRAAVEAAGIRLDVLGMDASIMGTIEALYEFRDLAPVIVSSQEVGEVHGWDYTAILNALAANPAMGGEDLSRAIVESYRSFLEDVFYPANPDAEKYHSIAALRTAEIAALGPEVDLLAGHLMDLLADPATSQDTLDLIASARAQVQAIDLYVQPYVYVDLVDLDRLLGQQTQIASLVSQAVIDEYHGAARPRAHGVSIVFFQLPEALDWGTYDPNYRPYDPDTNVGNRGEFLAKFRWWQFLDAYYADAGLL